MHYGKFIHVWTTVETTITYFHFFRRNLNKYAKSFINRNNFAPYTLQMIVTNEFTEDYMTEAKLEY